MAELTDAHRLYLQTMMSRGALREAEAKLLCKTVATSCGERYEEDDFPRFTDALNVHLKQLGMELVSAVMEDSPDRWYGLVNRSQDEAAKIGSKYSPAQLELFNKIIILLVAEARGEVRSIELLNSAAELERKLSAKTAQDFLQVLLEDKWLAEVSRGVYGPGPRFILELRPFLPQIFPGEVLCCHTCEEPVIRGQSCEQAGCQTRLHLYCLSRLVTRRGGRGEGFKCPGCRADWPHELPDIAV